MEKDFNETLNNFNAYTPPSYSPRIGHKRNI